VRPLLVACAVALVGGVVVSVAFAGWTAASARQWAIRDLGTLGGPESVPSDINERGWVVGNSDSPRKRKDNPNLHEAEAFLWKAGRTRRLGRSTAEALAINDRGQVVGSGRYGWFLWQDGRLRYHGMLGESPLDEVVAINERGYVVGGKDSTMKHDSGAPIEHAFLWKNGRMVDLTPSTSGWSRPVALNDRGQVLIDGQLQNANGLWEQGRFLPLARRLGGLVDLNERGQVLTSDAVWQQGKAQHLGTKPFKYCVQSDINDRGVVVGACSNRPQPAIWKGRNPTYIRLAFGDRGQAVAVNNVGQVVGYSTRVRLSENRTRHLTIRHPTRHAFVWEKGHTTDLGTLGGPDSEAIAINDQGQIVGWADTKRGNRHAVVWTRQPTK
jgi:probable HAF family extracellular repeat protein